MPTLVEVTGTRTGWTRQRILGRLGLPRSRYHNWRRYLRAASAAQIEQAVRWGQALDADKGELELPLPQLRWSDGSMPWISRVAHGGPDAPPAE